MKFILTVISVLLLTASHIAQINIRSVESFTVEDGLSQNSVHNIMQGSNGLMWLGTQRNINKYDGYDITPAYLLNTENISSTLGTVYDITEDADGGIWFGTSGSANRLDIRTEVVKGLDGLLGKNISTKIGTVLAIHRDGSGNIWLGTFGKGLFKVSHNFSSITNYTNSPDGQEDSSLDYIRDIYDFADGTLWLGTYGGLVKFDTAENKFDNLFYHLPDSTLRHTTVNEIIPVGSRIILPTNNRGILQYDIKRNEITELPGSKYLQLSRYNVRDIFIDEDGNVWAAVYGLGVVVIDEHNDSYSNLTDEIENIGNTGITNSLSLIFDRSGILWVGTEYNGLIKIVLGERNIGTINTDSYPQIGSTFVNAVAKDANGKVWLSTPSGLYKIDRENNSAKRLKISDTIGLRTEQIYNILSAYGKMWVTKYDELIEYSPTDDSYEPVYGSPGTSITELYVMGDNKLVIGNSDGMITFLDVSNRSEKSVYINGSSSNSPTVTNCRITGNTLWIATADGLYEYDLRNQAENAKRIRLNLNVSYITSLTADDENVWFTTYGSGLYRYNRASESLTHISKLVPFPDNVLYGVLADDDNNLWISSNKGIYKYYPGTNMLKVFNMNDGLQGYEYNGKAYTKASDGEMFFGGVNGLNHFHPASITENETAPETIITKVTLHDSTIISNITHTEHEYIFGYNENSLSFEFSALDFTNPEKNTYQYKLDGVNKEWVHIGGKHSENFANLAPGDYSFYVRGSNNDQVYDKTAAMFSFTILPPFWATWWFRVTVVFIILSLLYLYYQSRLTYEKKRVNEIETIRKKIADDFHDDLGHKLTRISLYSELMKNNPGIGDEHTTYLNKIGDAANSLFYETKDFIWSLDPGNDTIYDLLVYLKDFGDDFFSSTGISFSVDEIDKKFRTQKLPMKWKREVILIFKEAMNNSLKHSGADNVELKASYKGASLLISLVDNGNGFDTESDNNKGRGLDSMIKRADEINAQLDIKSERAGTIIKLKIDLNGMDK